MDPSAPAQTRILVIENSRPVRRGIAEYLMDSGFQVLEADSGPRGLALLHQERPDLVLCDLRLPGMDGLDVLSLVRQGSPDTPVILLSDTGVVGDAVRALRQGAWDYLTQPIADMALLDSAIGRVLERVRLVQENRHNQRQLEALTWKLDSSLKQLRQDEEAGRKIQLRMSPPENQRIGAYRFQRRQFPSLFLSGDLIDYFPINERYAGFYMSDVMGHGAASAFVTVMLKTLVRTYRDALWQQGDPGILEPESVLGRLNEELLRQSLEKNCALFYGVLDHQQNRLYYSVAGHYPYPVLIEGYQLRMLPERGRPIGIFDDVHYRRHELQLPEQFGLLLVSDGVLELLPMDPARPRIQTFLNLISPELDLDVIIKGFQIPEGEVLPDDISLLLISRDPTHG